MTLLPPLLIRPWFRFHKEGYKQIYIMYSVHILQLTILYLPIFIIIFPYLLHFYLSIILYLVYRSTYPYHCIPMQDLRCLIYYNLSLLLSLLRGLPGGEDWRQLHNGGIQQPQEERRPYLLRVQLPRRRHQVSREISVLAYQTIMIQRF